jgi:hypothetical protein
MSRDIKPGYLLKIRSWKNDADFYNTKEVDGLSWHEAFFLIKVAQLFQSQDSETTKDCFGNNDIDYLAASEVIDEIANNFRKQGFSLPKEWEQHYKEDEGFFNEEFYYDQIENLIGTWNCGECTEYFRVFDSFEVFWVPENAIKNVTYRFS